jgi:hypothetical protein
MRFIPGVLALAALAVLSVGATPAGAATITDQLCPEATQYVNTLADLGQNETPQKVYDASHAVTSAYETCQKRHLSNGNVEPGVHYAYTRQASYGVVEARALLALNRPGDAKSVLETSKRLASEVVDWRRNMSFGGDSKDSRPSIYRNAAKDVVSAANELLAKLNAPSTPPAAPAFTPAPKSSPSP